MFYCDDCREKRGWPEATVRSHGPCELCGEVGTCHDVPTSKLRTVRPLSDEARGRLKKARRLLREAHAEVAVVPIEDAPSEALGIANGIDMLGQALDRLLRDGQPKPLDGGLGG